MVVWEDQADMPWDGAVKGSSSLQAVLIRRASVEAAKVSDEHAIEACMDIGKCNDTIDVVELILRLEEHGFPLQVHIYICRFSLH